MRTLEEHTKEFNYKLKNIKFDFSAEHLILVAEELETGEYAHIDEYITLSGKMLRQQQAEIERFKNNYMALFQDFTKQQAKIEEMLDALIAVEVWLSSGCGTNFEAKVNSAIRKAQEK